MVLPESRKLHPAQLISKAATGSRRQTRDRTLRLVPDMTMTRSITTRWSNFWLIMQRNKSLEILQEDAPE